MKTHLVLALITAVVLHGREVAITIDDLPVGQSAPEACQYKPLQALTERLLAPLRDGKVPVAAFLIAGNCPSLSDSERRNILRAWTSAGAEIGNHTYTHAGLNKTPLPEYEADILRADVAIRKLTGSPVRFFRSPMLQTGPDAAAKTGLSSFLAAHGYRQAPVTFDNSDWMFAYVYNDALAAHSRVLADRIKSEYVPYLESVIAFFEGRSVEVAGRDFPQVLLLHANRLNSEMLPDILAMLRRRGYRFISLEEALRDPVYSLPDEYAGQGGFSWIHRWSRTKGMKPKGEPDEPEWLRKAYEGRIEVATTP